MNLIDLQWQPCNSNFKFEAVIICDVFCVEGMQEMKMLGQCRYHSLEVPQLAIHNKPTDRIATGVSGGLLWQLLHV